ncbi:MAG: ubiquinone biosynthesis regulatory protein kinase UbiB [Gammaproteobacteria bacterium]|nr:MAG: ubiquinone biosynthesis regulatory protein kinase UbiB [Gammaproteobacteria bacterium]
MPIAQAARLLNINRILTRYGLDEITQVTGASWAGALMRLLAPRPRRVEELARGERIRLALEELGPIFVKFGQILSTRRDVIPEDIADELTKLQDQVAPFPGEQAQAMIEEAYGQTVEEVFAEFSVEPLASASVAQVHAARLKDGTEVVVKVLRPGVREQIERDIYLLYGLAQLAERYLDKSDNIRPVEIVEEIEKTILAELDLKREGANASLLRKNFAGSSMLYVPEVFWDYTNESTLVLERVSGVPVDDVTTLRAAKVNMQRLAETSVEIFYTQVFRDNFFHADMHPGNILVDISDPEYPKFIALDFGIVGTLSPLDQRYVAENFLAFFNRDYKRVAELHVDAGWVPPDTRIDELEAEVRTVCEPMLSRKLGEISFGELLAQLFRAAQKFDLRVQPQLMLLQKTLLNIEGLGRQLHPQLDIWQTAQRVLEKVMKDKTGPSAAWRDLKQRFPLWVEKAPEIPGLVYDVLHRASEGRLRVRLDPAELKKLDRRADRRHRQHILSVLGGALLIGAAVVFSQQEPNPTAASWLGGLMAASGLGAVFAAWRKR